MGSCVCVCVCAGRCVVAAAPMFDYCSCVYSVLQNRADISDKNLCKNNERCLFCLHYNYCCNSIFPLFHMPLPPHPCSTHRHRMPLIQNGRVPTFTLTPPPRPRFSLSDGLTRSCLSSRRFFSHKCSSGGTPAIKGPSIIKYNFNRVGMKRCLRS